MDPNAYEQMADTEHRHWWFVARRDILDRILRTLKLPPSASILEVGSGTGGNLEMLARHGTVCAVEMDKRACDVAREKTGGRYSILTGHFPDNNPLDGKRFDLICMFDVLEHIEQDIETLAALRELLEPGGRILITVPAYMWLWGSHDVFLHHKRRYTARTLRHAILGAGLNVDRLTYFNTLLLPIAAIVRWKGRFFARGDAGSGDIPSSTLNRMLLSVFRAERRWLTAFDFPAGVSLLAVVHQ